MLPVLFTIGSYNVYAFGFFLAIAFILSTFIVWKLTKDELKEEEYIDVYLCTSIAMLISSRVGYMLLHPEQFGFNILKYILVRETPGLSLIAGLVGGFCFLLWYTRTKKLHFVKSLDIFSIAISVGLGFVKIGEQLGGAGFGKETSFPLAVRIAGMAGTHHPAEIYEALLFFILALFLWLLYRKTYKRELPEGMVFYIFTIFLFLIIFLLEFLKLYPVYLIGLSQKQIASIVLVIPAIYKLITSIKLLRSKKS